MRIDIHAHAFADAIAERAMTALRATMPPDYSCADGRLGTLLSELEAFGFDAAVICSIATKPTQFDVIMKWSDAIRQGALGEAAARRIIPFLSVHPRDPDRFRHVEETARAGFKGLKIHPYYQECPLDAPEMIELLRCARQNELVVMSHVGYDIAFPRDRLCDPARVLRVLDAVPGLKLIASHFGGWTDWDEAERLLVGQPVDLDISMTRGHLDPVRMRAMLLRHPLEHLHFGSDWPWSSHAGDLALIESFDLPPARLAALMGDNSARLLGLDG